jgi:hypothetical protein
MSKWFAFVDVSKAYDNVDLYTLDVIIRKMDPPEAVLREWQAELRDLTVLNMDICGDSIRRTNGLPQGSDLAPALFNIYTTDILHSLDKQDFMKGYEIRVFADNWVIFGKDSSRLKMVNLLLTLNAYLLDNYSLRFTMDEAEIVEMNDMVEETKSAIKILRAPYFQAHTSFKFLGVTWYVKDKCVKFNAKDYQWKFAEIRLAPAFVVFLFIKRYLVPKFNYYYKYLKILDFKTAETYYQWFKENLRIYLRKKIMMLHISDSLIEELIQPKDPNKIWRKYLGPYLATLKKIENENRRLTEAQLSLLRKLKEVAEYVLNYDKKVGIYQLINFIFKKRSVDEYFEKNEQNMNVHQRNRTWMVIDLVYYGIMTEKRFSSLTFREQEKFMDKTLRKRCYRIL